MGQFPSIKENKAFRGAYYRGKSAVDSLVVTYARKNRTGVTRVGITVSKKVGKAVVRNRCRRVIRAAYASLKDRVAPGYDLVFVARGKTAFVKSTELALSMERQLKKLAVLADSKEERV